MSRAQPVIYLDLDHTLIDTDRLGVALREASSRLFAISVAELNRTHEDFRVDIAGGLHYYPFFSQLARYGVDPKRAEEQLRESLRGQLFLYDDAADLLAYLASRQLDAHILTIGETQYQTFKTSLVPELQALRVICVQAPKAEYISKQGDVPALIVDDLRVHGLPPMCQGVMIDRTQVEPQSFQNDYVTINDLRIAKELCK